MTVKHLPLKPAAVDDGTPRNDREVNRLHADQESILEHLRGGPQDWLAVRRRLHVVDSESRASETRRQLAALIGWRLIEECGDGRYRLTVEGLAVAAEPGMLEGF